tara:strand:- start:40488 stop:40649 length:162 start_codon:yes stop_codon:yes gene_type:complete
MQKESTSAEKEKNYLKKHFKEMFFTYLESEVADCQKDRQHKLFVFLEIRQKLK